VVEAWAATTPRMPGFYDRDNDFYVAGTASPPTSAKLPAVPDELGDGVALTASGIWYEASRGLDGARRRRRRVGRARRHYSGTSVYSPARSWLVARSAMPTATLRCFQSAPCYGLRTG